MAEVKERRFHLDGFMSLLSGIGRSRKDKSKAVSVSWCRPSEQWCDYMYAGSDIAKKVVDLLPNEALRRGEEFLNLSDSEREKLTQSLIKLKAREKLRDAWRQARLYGGAAIVLIPRGSKLLSEPFVQGEEIESLVVMSAFELLPLYETIDTDFTSENFGLPKMYQIQMSHVGGALLQTVHYTRMIRFDGAYLPRQLFISNSYWHDSVLTVLEDAIKNHGISYQGMAAMLQDFDVSVFKIKNLAEMISAGHEQTIRDRMDIMAEGKSNVRAVVMDEHESFENIGRNVSGLGELLSKLDNRLVASTDIPHTKLLGESPTASNGTGSSTVMGWYDTVSAAQDEILKPRYLKLCEIILGQLPESFDIEFKSLWQLDDKEIAQVRNTQAQTDAIYIERGVVDAEEVRASRFGKGKYSLETEVDSELPINLSMPETE